MGSLPLQSLFQGPRPPERTAALDGGRERSWGDFGHSVAAAARWTRESGLERCVLACEDAWAFSVGFFGLLHGGCAAVIPANHLPATLERLMPQAGGILTDLKGLPSGMPWHPLPAPGEDWPEGTLAGGQVEFWTSGSSGEPKRVPKDLVQLDREVAILEAAFGSRVRGPVFATVPHQHIYGCLFRILWPLAAGRPLVTGSCGDPSSFRRVLRRPDAPALVTSPALLSRLAPLLEPAGGEGGAAAIFSSGGPLEAEASVPWLRWTPNGVIEIYGSTETGGIGWRVQRALGQPAPWTPFPDLSLSREPDGALRVLSPRAGAEAVRMEDRVEWVPGGGFLLRGRLDRIVKVEEKRVSLPEVEAALEAHPWVRRAALTLLDGPRQVLGAVVVLSREGRSAAQDRHRLCQELRGHLAVRFEGVALPRRWRFPEELPFNERGKLAPADLAALFLASGTKEESLP